MLNPKALDAYLDGQAKHKTLAGVSACVMGPSGLAYSWQYGYRDAAMRTPVDEGTMFGIASMSKSITALCLCILEAEGKLRLSDPVSRFVPGFRLPGQPAEAVTLWHLMNHTSGLPPMEPLEWSIVMNTPNRCENDWSRALKKTAPNAMATLEQLLDYIAHCPYPMLGAPGEIMSYSNEGYAILSYAVDAAAGMPLERFMRERVFAPLGMTRSLLDNGIDEARALSGGNLTSLFEREDGVYTCDDAWSILPPFRGCAMVKSTARDMAVYYRALSQYGLHEGRQALPRRAVERLLGAYHPLSDQSVMCLGINKREKAGHILCEHSGGLHGVSTKGGLLLGEGYGFAVLCNQGDEDMDELMWGLYNAFMGLPLEESHQTFVPTGEPFSAPEMLTGRYIDHEGVPCPTQVRLEGTVLAGQRGDNPFVLAYCGGTRFLALSPTDGHIVSRLEFLIRDGAAWGVRCGTRVSTRLTAEEAAALSES